MTHSEYLAAMEATYEANSYWINRKAFDVVESKAYELGHSSGYNEVLQRLEDLLDFVSNLNRVL